MEERREQERQSKLVRAEERAAARQEKESQQKSNLARLDEASTECRLHRAVEHRKHCGWDEDEYSLWPVIPLSIDQVLYRNSVLFALLIGVLNYSLDY